MLFRSVEEPRGCLFRFFVFVCPQNDSFDNFPFVYFRIDLKLDGNFAPFSILDHFAVLQRRKNFLHARPPELVGVQGSAPLSGRPPVALR